MKNNIALYCDCGAGFESLGEQEYRYYESEDGIKLEIELPKGARKAMLRPAKEGNCAIKKLLILSDGKKLKFGGNYSFSDDRGNLLFLCDNPQILVNLSYSASVLEISMALHQWDSESEGDFYSQILPLLLETDKRIKNYESRIRLLKKSNFELSDDLAILRVEYSKVLGSFYWRITGIPRKLTHRLKLLIKKCKPLHLAARALRLMLLNGPKDVLGRIKRYFRSNSAMKNISLQISAARRAEESKTAFPRDVKISVLVPLYNTPEKYLREMIGSLINQTYANWELCLADGSTDDFAYVGRICLEYAENDKRIVYKKLEKNLGISENTNACLELASGEYIGLFDHDDLLHPSLLFEVMNAICKENADFIYTDEVTFSGDNTSAIICCNFKPDYSPDTLRSYNYICHFSVFGRELLERAGGGFNSEYDGSQDYDLILRLTEKAEKIYHIPKALYFWRSHAASTASSISAKPYIVKSAHKALDAHLRRVGLVGEVKDGVVPSVYKIDYDISGEPLISIIIPNKDHTDDLDKCLSAIFDISSYRNFEIIIAENNSTDPATFEYYDSLKGKENVKVVYWEKEFNYSAINNFAVSHSSGEYLLLLNNDIETITANWLEEMLMFAQRPDVGAVGAKLYYPDDTIQHAGVIVGVGGVAGHGHKHLDRSDVGFMTRASIVQNLSACTAACLMIRRDVFEEVGGIDEGYAVAFNDIDLCLKIREAGYLIVFNPYAELYHYESKSRGDEDTPEKVARFNREITRFESRWGGFLEKGDPYYNPNLTLEYEDFSLK